MLTQLLWKVSGGGKKKKLFFFPELLNWYINRNKTVENDQNTSQNKKLKDITGLMEKKNLYNVLCRTDLPEI